MNENRQNTTLHIEQAIKAKEDLHRQYTVLKWVLEIEAISRKHRYIDSAIIALHVGISPDLRNENIRRSRL